MENLPSAAVWPSGLWGPQRAVPRHSEGCGSDEKQAEAISAHSAVLRYHFSLKYPRRGIMSVRAGMEKIWFSVNLCLKGGSWNVSTKIEILTLGALPSAGFYQHVPFLTARPLLGSPPTPVLTFTAFIGFQCPLDFCFLSTLVQVYSLVELKPK